MAGIKAWNMMTKRQGPVVTARQAVWVGFAVVVVFSVLICATTMWKLHSESSRFGVGVRRKRGGGGEWVGVGKIAFLFLVRRDLPLDFLWGSFFEGVDAANYSIYIHSQPGFVFGPSTTKLPVFYGRQLSNSIQVGWGESSMIEAERLLLDAALEDPANQRFVLLSDSCVPLYNFSYIYKYIMASQRSFVDSFLDPKDERYHPRMPPYIPKYKWRKGSQWITLVRKHAEVVVDDEAILPVFQRYCKRRPPVDESLGKQNIMRGLEKEIERRTLTYTLWKESGTKMERKSWHPVTFSYATANPERIKKIKAINHVFYETEYRTEWCRTNSTPVPCFLFARKISPGAAMRLLSDGLVTHNGGVTVADTQQ